MIRFQFSGPGPWRGLPLLFCTLAAAGCGSDASVTPAAPSLPPVERVGDLRTVEITDSLITQQGSCTEATILYDGQELLDARSRCVNASGCARLDLNAVVRTAEGDHTIEFQILGQQPDSVEYVAQARVRVSRDGFSGTATLDLGPTRAVLRSGEMAAFDPNLENSLG